MKKAIKSLALASIALSLFGCESSSDQISIVKNSKLQPGSTISVGRAFDASFGSTSWTTEETAKGRKYVMFQGDVDKPFLDMLASSILDEGVTSLVTLGNCVDSDFAGEMIGNTINAGLSALFSFGKVDAGKAMAEPVSKRLQEKDLRLTVTFDFIDDTNFRMGFIGFKSEDWKDCELMNIINQQAFIDFVYSDHEYVKTQQLPKTEKPKKVVSDQPSVEAQLNVTTDSTAADSTAAPVDNTIDSAKVDTVKTDTTKPAESAPAKKAVKKVAAKEKVAPVEQAAPAESTPAEGKKSKKRRD